MAIQSELVAPISVDLRAEDKGFNIIKGIEHVNYKDEALYDKTLSVLPGEWMTKTANGLEVPGSGNAVGNVYPVVVGNSQYDAVATGQLTILVGGGFIYETNKFATGSYTVGQALCVKDLGSGERVPSAAGGSDAIVARVYAYDAAKGLMQIQVLDR